MPLQAGFVFVIATMPIESVYHVVRLISGYMISSEYIVFANMRDSPYMLTETPS